MDIRKVFKMSNETYDKLKFTALIILPALATFYLTFSQIWELPYGEKVSATIMAVDLLLGAVLGISSALHKEEK